MAHVAPAERDAGFARLAALQAPGGRLLLSFRTGTHAPEDSAWAVDLAGILAHANANRWRPLRIATPPDLLGRSDVAWRSVLLQSEA